MLPRRKPLTAWWWAGAEVRPTGSTIAGSVTALAPSPCISHPWMAADDAGGLWAIPEQMNGSSKQFFTHGNTVNALSCLPEHVRAVSASDDESVVQWTWREGSSTPLALHKHFIHRSYVMDAAIRAPDLLVASIGLDQRLVLSSASVAEPLAVISLPDAAQAVTFCASPLPLLLLTSPDYVRLCDLRLMRNSAASLCSIERIWSSSNNEQSSSNVPSRIPFGTHPDSTCRVLNQYNAIGPPPAERFDRLTGRYYTPPSPHSASLFAAAPLSGHLAILTICKKSQLCVWRTDSDPSSSSSSTPLLHSDASAPSTTPAVRPAVAGNVIATCHGPEIAIRTERSPYLSEPCVLPLPRLSFRITALALAASHGPLLIGDASGAIRLVQPHAPDGDLQ